MPYVINDESSCTTCYICHSTLSLRQMICLIMKSWFIIIWFWTNDSSSLMMPIIDSSLFPWRKTQHRTKFTLWLCQLFFFPEILTIYSLWTFSLSTVYYDIVCDCHCCHYGCFKIGINAWYACFRLPNHIPACHVFAIHDQWVCLIISRTLCQETIFSKSACRVLRMPWPDCRWN